MTWYSPIAEDGFFRCNHSRAPPYYLQANLEPFGAESTESRWSKEDRRRAGSFLLSILQRVHMTCKILSLLWTPWCSYWKSWKHFSCVSSSFGSHKILAWFTTRLEKNEIGPEFITSWIDCQLPRDARLSYMIQRREKPSWVSPSVGNIRDSIVQPFLTMIAPSHESVTRHTLKVACWPPYPERLSISPRHMPIMQRRTYHEPLLI